MPLNYIPVEFGFWEFAQKMFLSFLLRYYFKIFHSLFHSLKETKTILFLYKRTTVSISRGL